MNPLLSSSVSAIFGGVMIGLASVMVLLGLGRVAGVSGILGGVLSGSRELWRVMFLLGLFSGGLLLVMLLPESVAVASPRPLMILGVAGLLVGLGTSIGNGCTSGHGICGNGRLSLRSMVATITFMAAGALTASFTAGMWQGVAQ